MLSGLGDALLLHFMPLQPIAKRMDKEEAFFCFMMLCIVESGEMRKTAASSMLIIPHANVRECSWRKTWKPVWRGMEKEHERVEKDLWQ